MLLVVKTKSLFDYRANRRFAPGQLSTNCPGLKVRDQPIQEFGGALAKPQREGDGGFLCWSAYVPAFGNHASWNPHRAYGSFPGPGIQDLREESILFGLLRG